MSPKFLGFFRYLTYVLVLPALLPVPDAEVEALLGEVRGRGRVHELLVEVGAEALPLDRRLLLGVLAQRVEDAAMKQERESKSLTSCVCKTFFCHPGCSAFAYTIPFRDL